MMERDQLMEKTFPGFPWRKPLRITTSDRSVIGCRFCLAHFGLKAWEIPQQLGKQVFLTEIEFQRHMVEHHA